MQADFFTIEVPFHEWLPAGLLLLHWLGGQISTLHVCIYVECLLTLQLLQLPIKIVVPFAKMPTLK